MKEKIENELQQEVSKQSKELEMSNEWIPEIDDIVWVTNSVNGKFKPAKLRVYAGSQDDKDLFKTEGLCQKCCDELNTIIENVQRF